MTNMISLYTLALLATCLQVVSAFYLPGVAPTDYDPDQNVPLLVNSLTPGYDTQMHLKSLIPYDYYFNLLNFCKPPEAPKKQSESLGSILFGDRIFNSPFELFMLKNESCKQLCTREYEVQNSVFTTAAIRGHYDFNWLIDGLPAATELYYDEDTKESFTTAGFPLGSVDVKTAEALLNNHYDITMQYHKTIRNKYRVVGVFVKASSRNNKGGDKATCDATEAVVLSGSLRSGKKKSVTFTYSVTWVESPTIWATRWDKYLRIYDPNIHWFSLFNSAIIAAFLSGAVGAVLLRGVRKDIATYNEVDLSEEVHEDSGWKLVHGDVFRSPKNRMLLSVLLGSGVQLLAMTGLTLIFALFGFLSPSNRGSLSTVVIILYVFFGFIGGYVSARFYKTFGGEAFILNTLLVPTLIPGIIFGTFLLLNFFLVFSHSSGAVPFGTMLAIVAIWFVVSVPLSALGSFMGNKKDAIIYPVRTNQIARQIPNQPRSLNFLSSTALVGLLPFGAIFVELYYIYNSLWFHKIYYMFGFLFLCYGLMLLTSATVTVLLTYFLLRAENYHWQWRSFFAAGACSFYVFIYALVYLYKSLSLGSLTSYVLYVGYSFLISFLVFVLTGSVGFICSFFFTRRIYASIKID